MTTGKAAGNCIRYETTTTIIIKIIQIITTIDAYIYQFNVLLQKPNYEACQCKQTLLYLFILAYFS